MRLSRSIGVVLGVAFSGSVALFFGGSALAADNRDGLKAPVAVGDQAAQVAPTVMKDDTKDTTALTTASGTISVKSSKTEDVDSDSSVVISPAASGDSISATTTDGSSNAAPVQTASKAVDSAAATPVAGSSVSPSVGISKTVSLTPTPVSSAVASPMAGVPVAAVMATPVVKADPVEGSDNVVLPEKAVVFNSTVLPVQPKITNSHSVGAQDLAAAMPSAPAQQQNPTKAPTPSQPSGLFTKLATELAGTVVPQLFTPTVSGFVNLIARLSLMFTELLLLVGLFGMSFGAWLRRSGYAHAARSDMASGFLFLFATPFQMSYVTALSPEHSSFLMVSETKSVRLIAPNAIRKEEAK
jgi:hypothetical protein